MFLCSLLASVNLYAAKVALLYPVGFSNAASGPVLLLQSVQLVAAFAGGRCRITVLGQCSTECEPIRNTVRVGKRLCVALVDTHYLIAAYGVRGAMEQ